MNNPIVSVCVLTYNQEAWIRRTIESILAQKTTYAYEIIIGEDCSTDGTGKICEEYANQYDNIIIAPQEHNLGVVGNYVNCVKLCHGKYKMGCAGDDFWHNPNKMQMQVDFMETHPDCVICHTDIDTLFFKTGNIEHNSNQVHNIVPPEGKIQRFILSGRGCIKSMTMCIRMDLFKKYVPIDKFVELGFAMEDYPVLFILSAYGNINYIPVSTATYMVGQPSITNEINYDKIRKKYNSDKVMSEYLYSLFPELGPFDDGLWYDRYVYHSLLVAAYQNNDYKNAKLFAQEFKRIGLDENAMSRMARCWFTFKLYKFLKDSNH